MCFTLSFFVGVSKCGDISENLGIVKILFSEISFNSFLRISLGIGSTAVSSGTERDRKSLSTETTFKDTSDPNLLLEICSDLCKELATDLKAKNLKGRSVTVKIKTHDFDIKTKVNNLPEFTDDFEIIEPTAKTILRHFVSLKMK